MATMPVTCTVALAWLRTMLWLRWEKVVDMVGMRSAVKVTAKTVGSRIRLPVTFARQLQRVAVLRASQLVVLRCKGMTNKLTSVMVGRSTPVVVMGMVRITSWWTTCCGDRMWKMLLLLGTGR